MRVLSLCLSAVLLLSTRAYAGDMPELVPREIKVERVKPPKETRNTLRFLRENLDFLRGQLDYLDERPLSGDRYAARFDSSALRLRGLLASAKESSIELAQANDSLGENIEALLAAERDLARLEAEMGAQEGRLASLESLYLEAPATALLIVGRGLEARADTGPALRLRDDGGVEAAISPDPAPAASGLSEIYYERIEPRRQTWTLDIPGEAPLYLSFAPRVGETCVLELDLDAPSDGLPLRARLWSLE